MDKIDELLTRGVDKIYPSKTELEKVLRTGKKLRLYQGFDPTGTQLHIGHAVGLRKLRQWQDLGHHVIFLIGDGTGQAGDPSGKKIAREKFFNREELRKNALDYVMQAGKIVRFEGENAAEILFNGDWLNELKLVDVLNIAQNFSVQQLIERDMYQERIKKSESINLREFLYPLLQGYDSVAMDVDLEQGGTDQTFNMLAGRTLVKSFLNKEKFVMTLPLLTDSSGNKIGKSEGNVIGLTDLPQDLFGKIMSLPDSAIINCFTMVTSLPIEDVEEIKKELDSGKNPMVVKKTLAHQIVKELNSDEAAAQAHQNFESVFQKQEINLSDIPTFKIKDLSTNPISADTLLVETTLSSSKSEAKRLLKEGAVELGRGVVSENEGIELKVGDILKVGKKRFLKFI